MDIEQMQMKAGEASAMLKALANPSRLLVLCALVTREHTVGELEALTGLSQSAISQHLARLRDSELVRTRREAQLVYYSLENPEVTAILRTIHDIYCPDA